MKTKPKDGDKFDFGRKVEVPESPKMKWQPVEGNNQTMVYGKGTPTPSPSLKELAQIDVEQYYPYLLKGSPEYKRRVKEFLAKYIA